MQGVGPMQLTYYTFQDDADRLGGAWRLMPNMRVGFRTVLDNIRRQGLRGGIAAYNGTDPDAQRYATSVLSLERRWAKALGLKSIQR